MSRQATIVHNRQRKLPLDLDWARERCDSLFTEVCANLLRRRPAHMKKSLIAELSERGELSVVVVSDAQIRKLNREWRDKDKATDVLSFPLCLEPPPAGLPWEVGEIVISLPKAREQAETLGHSFEREFSFLFVHGLLHVLGFDHETERQEKEMFSRQNEVLDALSIMR